MKVRTDFFEKIALLFGISFGEQKKSGLFGLFYEGNGRFEPVVAVAGSNASNLPFNSAFWVDQNMFLGNVFRFVDLLV